MGFIIPISKIRKIKTETQRGYKANQLVVAEASVNQDFEPGPPNRSSSAYSAVSRSLSV
jgi:hypothetical protein